MYLLYTIYVSCAGHTAKYVAARKKTKDSKKKKDSMYLTAREGGAKSDLFVCPKCGAKDGYTHKTHTHTRTHAHTHRQTLITLQLYIYIHVYVHVHVYV
jgi:DNA-directed RNA polymerase subunit M/transcription elongation factor TFIIS